MNYRKLTKNEISQLFARFGADINKRDKNLGKIQKYVKQYYPQTAASVLVSYNSEYNDSTYDVAVQYCAIYDKDNNELLPIKGKEREARQKWNDVFYYRCENEYGGPTEPVEDKVYVLNDEALPELYVLE